MDDKTFTNSWDDDTVSRDSIAAKRCRGSVEQYCWTEGCAERDNATRTSAENSNPAPIDHCSLWFRI